MFGDWPWDGTAALFVETEIKEHIQHLGGGWKAWPIGDQTVHFNGFACSHSIKTPQSTSIWLGWG